MFIPVYMSEIIMTELLAVIVCVAFFVWMIWKLIISSLFYSDLVLYAIMIAELIINIILCFYSLSKWNIIFAIGVIIFGFFDFNINTGLIEFRQGIIDWLEERRYNISLWQDILIDMGFIIIIMQVFMVLI